MLGQHDHSHRREFVEENHQQRQQQPHQQHQPLEQQPQSSSGSSSTRSLFPAATLPRASMKRPHSLSNDEYNCLTGSSTNQASSSSSKQGNIMDHFKSIRTGRPRSRTMDSNVKHLLGDLLYQDDGFVNNNNNNNGSSSKSQKTSSNSVPSGTTSLNHLRNDVDIDADVEVSNEAIHDCIDGQVDERQVSPARDRHTSGETSSNDTGKFGTLLAAFGQTKRRQSSSSASSSSSSSPSQGISTLSISRPLAIRVESPKPSSSAVLSKASIPFPAQNGHNAQNHSHAQHQSCYQHQNGHSYQQAGSSKSSCSGSLSHAGSLSVLSELEEDAQHGAQHIPTIAEKEQFQRSLDSATALVFHRRNGIPLTSSPAPIRKSGTCFDFDSSLTSVNAIKKALFEKDSEPRHFIRSRQRARFSFSSSPTSNALLGNFEESVLNGRLEPASIVHGFTAEIGASGSFVPPHRTLPVTVFFYTLYDTDKGDKLSGSPYLGHIALGPKGYHVPRTGTVQVTLFNPNGTVVKMFVVRYDLSDMPPNSRTFLRQRTLFMPNDATENDPESRKWLRYLIHLRFQSSKSGRIRLHTDLRVLVFQKHDLDVATLNGGAQMELRSFVQMPSNPKYSKNLKT